MTSLVNLFLLSCLNLPRFNKIDYNIINRFRIFEEDNLRIYYKILCTLNCSYCSYCKVTAVIFELKG